MFIVLIGFAAYEFIRKSTQISLYWIAFGMLLLMLCLRFAQGTDYFTYYYYYLITPKLENAEMLFGAVDDLHGEIGWRLICSLFRTANIRFEILIGMVSLMEMLCLHRFLKKYSPMRTVSLLFAYPTLYLTYAVSAVRQGLVMMFFLGFMIDWLCTKKIKRYILATLVCALIHISAVIFLILPFIYYYSLNVKRAVIVFAVSIFVGFLANWALPKVLADYAYYAWNGVSIVAVAERGVATIIVMYCFHDILNKPKERGDLHFLLQIYLYSSVIYCFFIWNSFTASRFSIYFKAVEIVLFASALKKHWVKCYRGIVTYLIILVMVMYYKNINSYIAQGGYFESTNVWNYPYITVLDQHEIKEWREIPHYLQPYEILMQ